MDAVRRITKTKKTQIGHVVEAMYALGHVEPELRADAAFAAAKRSVLDLLAAVAGTDLAGRAAVFEASSEVLWRSQRDDINNALHHEPAEDFDECMACGNIEGALNAALSPHLFPGRGDALRDLRARGVNFNVPMEFGLSRGRCLPLLWAADKLSADDLELFLDIAAPDMAAVQGSSGTVLQAVLSCAQMTYRGFVKVCVVLARLPPAALTATFTTGLTPLQHVAHRVAKLRDAMATAAAAAADEDEDEVLDAVTRDWHRDQNQVQCELWDEVQKMLEARVAVRGLSRS